MYVAPEGIILPIHKSCCLSKLSVSADVLHGISILKSAAKTSKFALRENFVSKVMQTSFSYFRLKKYTLINPRTKIQQGVYTYEVFPFDVYHILSPTLIFLYVFPDSCSNLHDTREIISSHIRYDWLKPSKAASRRGYSQKNWVGVCGPLPKTLTLFMANICEFVTWPKFDTRFKNRLFKSIPCFRPVLN